MKTDLMILIWKGSMRGVIPYLEVLHECRGIIPNLEKAFKSAEEVQ